ncbi:MAG: hypothetical protein IKS64_05155 [Muribaculaceae bacterium]|nr:hypothetical protein [Muribaculaceae bacterium]MBR6432223.1 hypothetical protein [Muribaculaceae bacterium]
MENDNNMNELEQMREQMNIFKSRLDKQQIINEKLVRNSMGSKLSWIKNFVWTEIILVPILLLIMASFHYSQGLSWWLFAFLAIGLIADVVGDYIINRIPKSQLLSGDMVETSKRLIKMKKQRATWFTIGMIFVTIWLVWFIIELVFKLNIPSDSPNHSALVTIMTLGLAVSGLIGGFIAWLIFRKMQRTNNQLIEQINQIIQED